MVAGCAWVRLCLRPLVLNTGRPASPMPRALQCRFTGAKHCMSCSRWAGSWVPSRLLHAPRRRSCLPDMDCYHERPLSFPICPKPPSFFPPPACHRNYLKCNPGQCEDPFWRDRLGRCRNCTTSVAHCAACNDGTGACSACEYGYGLHSTAAGGTTCLPCEKACGDCRAGPKCAGCVGGYALARNGTCVACVDKNCVTCSSAKTCTSCAAGFEAVAGKCTPCADPNCGDCSRDLKTCYACRDGHEFERDVYATTRGRCQRCQPQNCRWCADPCTGALARCTDWPRLRKAFFEGAGASV